MPYPKKDLPKLRLLPYSAYAGAHRDDPLRFYYWPLVGAMYRRRVELCLAECEPGRRVLEVGFGSGATFLNLSESYEEIHGLDMNAPAGAVSEVFADMNVKTHLRNGNVLHMLYPDDFFDTVLLISILEHLKPWTLVPAFEEIRRVLRPGGQAIYGVPVERKLMLFMFRLLGYNIREHHFSTEKDVSEAADSVLEKVRVVRMQGLHSLFGAVYEVGHFAKTDF